MKKLGEDSKLIGWIESGFAAAGVKRPTTNADEEKMRKAVEDSYNTALIEEAMDYKETNFEQPEYQKLDTSGKSDEEIKEQAEQEQQEFVQHSQSAIEEQAQSGTKDLQDYKAKLDKNKVAQEEYIFELTKEQQKNVSNDALRRGLARSSIVINQLAHIDAAKAQSLAEVNSQYLEQIADADYQISQLETQKNVAIKNLQATAATKLALRIDELTKQRDEKITEAIKYNNTLEEKLKEFEMDAAMTGSEIALNNYQAAKAKVGLEGSQEYKNYQAELRYTAIKEYLFSLPKAKAIELMKYDSYYKQHLGTNRYLLLMSELESR